MRPTNPCGYAHPKNQPCRLCDAELARRRREAAENDDAVSEAHEPDDADSNVHEMADQDARREGVDRDGSKSERIEVAKSAVEDAIKREASSAAKKQRRYRERHGEAYRERERLRMKARRARIRGSPKSSEE